MLEYAHMPPIESHHHRSRFAKLTSEIREVVFGLGDGLVSTLGAVTGIAGATYDSSLVILTGLIVISVEAISMGAGEYLSSKSERELWEKRMREEEKEIADEPEREREELREFYRAKGLSPAEVETVSALVMQHPAWALEEMAVHELGIQATAPESPVRGAVFMFFAYMAGGLVPLSPYFFIPVHQAFLPSIGVTAITLFIVGAGKARFTTGRWIRGGLEMAGISLAAAAVGLLVGRFVVTIS